MTVDPPMMDVTATGNGGREAARELDRLHLDERRSDAWPRTVQAGSRAGARRRGLALIVVTPEAAALGPRARLAPRLLATLDL